MLTCIACTKQIGGGGGASFHQPEDDDVADTPSTRQVIKALTSQIKDMAVKASGAYRHCKPCAGSSSHRHSGYADSDAASGSERFHYSYRRAGENSWCSTPRAVCAGKDVMTMMESRFARGLSSGEGTPSVSGTMEGGVVLLAEEEPKEWVAQVEPGVLITFLSLPQGGNDLKRIRFRRYDLTWNELSTFIFPTSTPLAKKSFYYREMFNKWQAQRWWAENDDKVMELYNVQRFNRQAVPLPTPPRSEDESPKLESDETSPTTPPLCKERHPRIFYRPTTNVGALGYLSSDSMDHHSLHTHHHHQVLTSTPKLSSISGAKTETSSMDASVRTTSSSHEEADRSGELSVSNASDQETEWVEQDEPGVYITIRALPSGIKELRRVRFSRERFGEMHARLWWEENRARIHEQYL